MTDGPLAVLFWIVGAVALVWNGLGCMNFAQQMSATGSGVALNGVRIDGRAPADAILAAHTHIQLRV